MRFLSAFLLLSTITPGALADLDEMIPGAKEVRLLDESVPLEDGIILLTSDAPKCQIAAAEINRRIEELGSQALPLQEGPGLDAAALGQRPVVVLATATDQPALQAVQALLGESPGGVTPADPGPQGYVIRSARRDGGAWTFALVGSDDQGMLYAAVTFRHMLESGEDGVVVTAADVRDWPDFRTRNLGDPFEEPLRDPWAAMHSAAQKGDMARAEELAPEHIRKMQQYVDWLLRHKINMMRAHGSWSGGAGGLTDWERGIIRQINEYAKERGISAVFGANISIGTYPEDKDNPDFADIVMHSSHQRYFCWSRLKYHQEKAAAIAHHMRDCGYSALYLHDVDGGGWQNPALWDDRCRLCRETYGDDHAQADAVVFGIYYDALRNEIPDATFLAVIYPYSGRYLDPAYIADALRAQMGEVAGIQETAARIAGQHRNFIKRLDSLVPDDWHICIRESEREVADRMREAWGKHPFYTYFEYMRWRSWQPWFSTSPRWTGTFHYPGYNDVLYGSIPAWGFRNPLRLYAAECAWNSRGPDYEPFNSRAWGDYRQTQSPRELAEKWALRVAGDLWGGEVAPYTLPLLTLNLSPKFIFDTEAVADRTAIDDIPAVMAEQFDAAQRCCDSMDQLFERIRAGEIVPKEQHFGELTNYYRFVVAAKALAGYKHQKAGIHEAIVQGDETLTDERIAALEQDLQAWEDELARVREATRGLPIAESYARKTVAKGYLLALTTDELQSDLEELLGRREELFAAYNMPRWFREVATNREFHATRAGGPVVVDGKLDEEVWGLAEPIEHFVQYDQLRLASRETVARIAYDDANVYIAFECLDPAPSEIEIFQRDRDRFEQTDSVEIFLDVNDDDQTFCHYYVDLGGNVFDAARTKQADGTLKHESAWDGNMREALARQADRWIAELAIPVADLGAAPKPGATWGVHIARNIVHGRPERESVAPQFMEGEGFHTVARFAPLNFEGPESRVQPPKVNIEVAEKSLEPKVHEEGASTEARFSLRITTDRSLHNVKTVARLLNAEGTQVLEQTVVAQPWVELLWQSPRPVFLEVKRSYEGLLLQLRVTADEGTWEHRDTLGKYRATAPEADEVYGPGRAGEGDRALAAPMHCASLDYSGGEPRYFVPSAEGTIECWLCPTEDVVEDREADRLMRSIVDIGPVRYDHPYLTNYRTIAAYITKHAQLTFTITNARYENRSVTCKVADWKAGQWRHMACQWCLDEGGKCVMTIFVDGQPVSGPVRGAKEGPPDAALARKDEMLPIQVGAMNTGVGQARMLIDELRLSPSPRYAAGFVPTARLEVDPQTSLLFHFDNSLKPESGLADVTVEGVPGTAG